MNSPSEIVAAYVNEKEQKEQKKERRTYFLKLSAGFFKDKVIKKLRRLPGGDAYTIIVLEIFLEALENESRIYYDGVEDSLAKELALSLDEKPEAIQVVLDFLQSYGWLVEEGADAYFLPKSAEMSGSISARTERWQRQQKREKTAKIAVALPQIADTLPGDCRDLPQYISISRAISISREDREKEEEQDAGRGGEAIHLPELFPEAFISSKPKVSPVYSEVKKLCGILKATLIDPMDFYNRFSSQDWIEEGKEITDWQLLLFEMERWGIPV